MATYLTNVRNMETGHLNGEVDEDGQVDLEPSTAEAIALTVPVDGANKVDFTYSATAEDNGTAGALDLQPGLTYNGPDGGYVRVTVQDVDILEHAIINVPEAGDTVAMAIYKNSEQVTLSDEGYTTQDEIAAAEHNVDTIVGPLNPGDVIRVAVVGDPDGTNEEVAWDVAAAGTITLN